MFHVHFGNYIKLLIKTGYSSKSNDCKPQQLTAIGNRLLDWFSVIMADSKKRRQHNQKSKAHFPPACKTEAKWMFAHLDLNNDGILSLQELYDLEHDQNERCIKPFIDTCDLDRDNVLNTREWCRCFEKTDRPCAAVRRRIAGDFAGEIGTVMFCSVVLNHKSIIIKNYMKCFVCCGVFGVHFLVSLFNVTVWWIDFMKHFLSKEKNLIETTPLLLLLVFNK